MKGIAFKPSSTLPHPLLPCFTVSVSGLSFFLAARRADRGEEVGRGRLAIVSRDGLGVLAGVVARVERRAAAQEELAYCETSKNGSFVERGLPSFVALIDSRARVEQEDRCGALVV